MKISVNVMQKLSKIKNSAYDAIKIEYLYHSNKLEGSTFSKENLIDLLEQKQVKGEHFLDDVIETKNSLELFDVVINFKALIIFLVIFFLTKKFDKHPIVFIGIGALAGIVFKL